MGLVWSVKISENSTVTLGLFIVLAGGIFWLSTMYSEVKANSEQLRTVQQSQKEYIDVFHSIDLRLTHIEDAVILKEK